MTSTNRVCVIGPHFQRIRARGFRMTSLVLLQNKPCVLAFNLSCNTVRSIAVESALGTGPITIPSFPTPESGPYPGFFYSAATMENVCELQLSRVYGDITGMVLLYADGTKESLGSVFVPSLISVPRGNSSGLWILVAPNALGYSRVTDITVTRPLVNQESYLSVQWRGKLEWWFMRRHRQCHLYYKNVGTQQTCI